MTLASEVVCIPNDGLEFPKLRVEASEPDEPSSAWIAELNVLSDLPWLKAGEREIELRVMSDEFRGYVQTEKPNLIVKSGNEVIGCLDIKLVILTVKRLVE